MKTQEVKAVPPGRLWGWGGPARSPLPPTLEKLLASRYHKLERNIWNICTVTGFSFFVCLLTLKEF
jgi:hypothetical protein